MTGLTSLLRDLWLQPCSCPSRSRFESQHQPYGRRGRGQISICNWEDWSLSKAHWLASCHESKESWKVKSEVWSLCQVFSDPGDIRSAGYYRWSPKEAKPCPWVPWVGVFFQSYPRRNSGLWKLGVDAVSSPRHWVSFWKSPTPANRASSHVYFQRHRWFLSLTPTHPTPYANMKIETIHTLLCVLFLTQGMAGTRSLSLWVCLNFPQVLLGSLGL